MSEDEEMADAGKEARCWVVRLASGEIGAAEMRRLELWLAADAAHRAAFERERNFWQRIGGLEADFAPERGFRFGASFRRYRGAIGGAMAACLALFMLWDDIRTFAAADYRSAVGEQRVVGLPDGSVVHLNTDTAIAIRYAAKERRVLLLRGEALFEVAPDPDKPFRVAAADGVAQAVGTAFVVRAGPESASVLVTEGRVAVSSPAGADGAIEVGAGERAGYRRGEAPHAAEKAAEDAAPGSAVAWLRGKIVIDGMPLADAIAELDRYRRGRIVLLGGAAAGQPVSGVFDVGDVDEGIDALAATQGLAATRITPFLLVLR
ncbi:MAG: DUF4880 domain-containing protein [Alphaproteobacteria bacterium]|nr:DUF4880 domain-containing protein [Alphaproteobacteria bacterium]